MIKLILFNKPFNVLSQFTDSEGRETLSAYIKEKGFYPAGRLDRDSEGLLLLTNHGPLQHMISHPRHKMNKTYWVQVEGEINQQACEQLTIGVELKDGWAKALVAEPMAEPAVWERDPPVRYRKSIPTSWLRLTINEGRNRQVRRMTAAAGFPTLRLIRYSIGDWMLGELQPGEYNIVSPNEQLLAKLSKYQSNKPQNRKPPQRNSRSSLRNRKSL